MMAMRIILGVLGGLLALGMGIEVAEGAGIHRRSIYAIYSAWQAPYQNGTHEPQRILILSKGSWFFGEHDQATSAGVPWTSELRDGSEKLLLSACAPFSLVAKIENGEEEPAYVCLSEGTGFYLPAGAKLFFGINEIEGGHKDNSGLLRLEVLVSDRRR